MCNKINIHKFIKDYNQIHTRWSDKFLVSFDDRCVDVLRN